MVAWRDRRGGAAGAMQNELGRAQVVTLGMAGWLSKGAIFVADASALYLRSIRKRKAILKR